jgi:superfamily II DNA or RNA helicase
LVIVDEVHTAAQPGGHASGEQQLRHELVRRVAEQSDRHLLLLTATPHSGVEESFRSLLGLLKPEFAHLPLDRLTDTHRARLARHYVQRLRADVSRWMDTETRFPTRDPQEESYELSPQYAALFEDLLAFTREIVAVPGLSQPRQRVRYWAALALLRCVMSSPAAAVEALLGRAKAAAEEAEEEFREWQVLDPIREEGTNDTVPASAVSSGEHDLSGPERRRLREFARRAHEIADRGADTKIAKAMEIVGPLLQQGYSPIIYCRFIETAKYVRDQLEQRLRDRFPDVHVVAVTSETGDDEEREARVAELAKSPVRVLVATDCLSEGVNLQEHFNAVLHYDLPWNPNRLEQREGRVDRFGQVTPVIPAVLLYGKDNRIDLIVLDVLIRKAHQIFRATGVRVPVPVDSESVMKALAQALFEGRAIRHEQIRLDLEEVQTVEQFHRRWERDAEHEKVSRSRFAQHAIRPDEVAAELQAADRAVGDPEAAQRFLQDAAQRLQLPMEWKNGHAVVAPAGPLVPLADRLGWRKPQRVVFESPPPTGLQGAEVVSRNHPLVVWTADRIINAAFAPTPDRRFARCGAAYTAAVKRRTTLLLLRIRYRLTGARGREHFGEEVVTTAFRPTGNGPEWLDPDSGEVLALLQARPIGSVAQDERVRQVEWALRIVDGHRRDLRTIAQRRAEELEAAHERLRQQTGGRRLRVEPYEPDVLGAYVLLPGGQR